jgi:quercetin dioxygenase-like cupin family protein
MVDDVIVGPGDGEMITSTPQREVVLLAAREKLSMTRSRYAPGERGPDPHVHRNHTDSFYVLQGELTFALGPQGDSARVPAGGFVAVPPNLIHSFVNTGSVDAQFLNFHSPDGGFAAFMRAARNGEELRFDSFDPPVDGGQPPSAAIVAGPGDGERLVSQNRVSLLKGVLPDICLAEFVLEGQFAGPDPHEHEAEVDSFYLLEGELEVAVEGSVHTVGPGTLASAPPGVRHTFGHRGVGQARFLNVHTPDGGFGDFLRRVSTGAARDAG